MRKIGTTARENDDRKEPPSSITSTNRPFLPGYQAQLTENGVDHSHNKLWEAEQDLLASCDAALLNASRIVRFPCKTEDETLAYRCSCTFQLVQDDDGDLQYAMRHRNEPVLLQSSVFAIANVRIQTTMKAFLDTLNGHDGGYDTIRSHLTSVSFSSAWLDTAASDCFVTLHYKAPIDEQGWFEEAEPLCQELQVTKMTGRAKKQILSRYGRRRHRDTIQDTVFICRGDHGRINSVCLNRSAMGTEALCVRVQYEKPETAFFHPNATVMCQALQWMIERLEAISHYPECSNGCKMLEMYCGGGAHTVALAGSGFLELIVAVEMDARLIDACKANCHLNNCNGSSSTDMGDVGWTPVHIFQGDAGEWAYKARRRMTQAGATAETPPWYAQKYQVLLVDPPRIGLDKNVCQMAIDCDFQHVLYISCGRQALIRDLGRLQDYFEIVNCTLLDLFPRTDSVESLVHLRRRNK